MQLLDGKWASSLILEELTGLAAQAAVAGKRPPHLAAVLVGSNGASETYVASKIRHCAQAGFGSTLVRLDDAVSQEELLAVIARLNADPEIDGFIVQLPLPKHIDADAITEAIAPHKDVDGFNPSNFGRVAKGLPGFVAATPLGILLLLERYQIPTEGKHCVVIGRSQIVGLPMAMLMQRAAYPGNATVTICHSRTQDLPAITRQADILVAALGRPGFIMVDMVKPGAVVIDVGLERVPDDTKKSGFRLAGDVDFASVAPLTSYITPVPGGVGLMTIAGLLTNTARAWQAGVGK